MSKREQYNGYYFIFTDGSKISNRVGCAIYSEHYQDQKQLPPITSIFTAEIVAVIDAVEFAKSLTQVDKIVIATDSLSVITSLEDSFSRNPLIQNIQDTIKRVSDKTIVMMWIPSHVNIQENEIVDNLAKTAIDKSLQQIQATSYDLISNIRRRIYDIWQLEWTNISNNKLRVIKQTTLEWKSSHCRTRKESVLLTRLRIGHSRMTHEHIFKKDPPPICGECNQQVTIIHLLSDCLKYKVVRDKYHINSQSILDVNQKELKCLFLFLNETSLNQKL